VHVCGCVLVCEYGCGCCAGVEAGEYVLVSGVVMWVLRGR
jgi:hypothetical protein